jgi:hypothetical protein
MRRWIVLLIMLACAISALAQGSAPEQALRFGIRIGPENWTGLSEALGSAPSDAANPVGVTLLLPASWAQAPDWPAFDAAVRSVTAGRGRLCISTGLSAGPGDEASLDYLANLSERAGAADALVLSLEREQFSQMVAGDPDQLALKLKRLTTALRGKTRASVLLGEVAADDLPLMAPLYDRDFRAYVEGYSSYAVGSLGEPDDEVVRFLQAHHLGAPIMLHLPKADSPIAAQLLVLLSASRGVDFVDLETSNTAAIWQALVHLRSLLSPEMAPGFSVQATEVRDASGPRADIALLNFLDAEQMVQAMALVPVISKSAAGTIELKLPTGDVATPSASPLPDGPRAELGYTADQKRGETLLRVPWLGKAQIIFFNRLKTGTVGEERLFVTGTYRIPVELILARHQAVQQPQDVFLENYSADAEVDYHFKLPGGTGSLDVTFRNSFFFQKGKGARWVQNQLLVNGVVWKGETIPNLPIIEPEKVNTLPLSLTLGRDYTYRYLRDETVDGHPCYVVEIIPAPGAKISLYSGKVWLDADTFVRRKMSVRQTGLQEPQISNDETDIYTPVPGPDGRTYWLLTRLVGQQIFSIAGVNVAAEREIRFTGIRVNDPAFGQEVAQAEASDKRILEETHQGLRYLKKNKDGTRTLEMEPETHRWFGGVGTYYDESLDYPLPLIGVNYFNYDFRKTKTQVNMFLAGAVNTFTLAKVDFLPSVDASANAILFALPFNDKFYPAGEEAEGQRVKVLRERINGGLGWRPTQFSKVSLDLDARYYRYSMDSETSDLFALPQDHFDLSATLGYSYARRGWTLSTEYEGHHRTDWAPWGPPGTHQKASDFQDYTLWNAAVSKAFYLPKFQKISLGATWMDGRDLDRFSKYQFAYMGRDSLSGFAGSGVRFDRGGVVRLAYAFNLANVIRFGLQVDQGRVQPSKEVDLWQNHTGIGLTGAVTGPWQTYWTVDVGYALRSDVSAVKGEYTAALMVLKVW